MTEDPSSWSIGERRVVPGKGVYEVTAIETREIIPGKTMTSYVLTSLEGHPNAMVPSALAARGLYPLAEDATLSSDQAEALLAELARPGIGIDVVWTRRREAYDDAVKRDEPDGLVALLRDVVARETESETSAIFRRARELLLAHLGRALPDEAPEAIASRVDAALER